MLCISISFWVLHPPKSWLKYNFLAVFNLFCWLTFFGDQEKTSENSVLAYYLKLVDNLMLVDIQRGYKSSLIHWFSDMFSWFWMKNHQKMSKIYKKRLKTAKKYFNQQPGGHSTLKLVEIHNIQIEVCIKGKRVEIACLLCTPWVGITDNFDKMMKP